MKRILSLFIVSMLTLPSFSLALEFSREKNKLMWKKITTYAQKHKKEIIAGGLTVIAAALGTGAAVYVNTKKREAMEDAGIDITKPGHLYYKNADNLISRYGILGKDAGIALLKKTKTQNQLNYIGKTENLDGKALAKFWGMSHEELAKKLGV